MFYVKAKISDAVELTTQIHDDNVFTVCPKCGQEVAIDIVELFRDDESDLYGTAVYCADCSRSKGVC